MVILKRYFSTFFAYFCFALLLTCIYTDAVSGVSADTLQSKVLRLHVLADSDSEEDQKLKLLVRDGLLDVTKDLFYDCTDVKEAVSVAEKNMFVLENTARKVLSDNGCDKEISVVYGVEKYPEKTYGNLTFPKGEYLSVRVIIGSGRGKNWWCVLFPPLCNAGIEESAQVLSSYGINEEEIEKLKKETDRSGIEIFGCRVKLKIFECFT